MYLSGVLYTGTTILKSGFIALVGIISHTPGSILLIQSSYVGEFIESLLFGLKIRFAFLQCDVAAHVEQ